MKGKIKFVNSQGFGFLTDYRKIDFFFHMKDYSGDWKELTAKYVIDSSIKVEFDVDITNDKAPKAINVKLIEN